MPSQQNVLIVGSEWSASLESSYARAFAELGWHVNRWDPIAALHQASRGGRFGRIFGRFIHVESWVRKANMSLLQCVQAKRPHVILVIGTAHVRAGSLAQAKVLADGALLYCLYPDSPHNLDEARLSCLPLFDRLATSSPAWVAPFRALGARRVDYLPFAADTFLHRPVDRDADAAPKHQVGFIGNWRPERETLLEQVAEFDLHIWGANYWATRSRRNSPLKTKFRGRELIGDEFAKACSDTAIMLNILDPVTWPGPNMRTFELPGCRAFPLVARSQAVLDLFTEGTNIACFEGAEEAREKIRYYLAHPEERTEIAQRAYDFVVHGGHTYVDRARTVAAWAAQDAAVAA